MVVNLDYNGNIMKRKEFEKVKEFVKENKKVLEKLVLIGPPAITAYNW